MNDFAAAVASVWLAGATVLVCDGLTESARRCRVDWIEPVIGFVMIDRGLAVG